MSKLPNVNIGVFLIHRFDHNSDVVDKGAVELPVIPTPIDFQLLSDNKIEIHNDWVVVAEEEDIGEYLAGL